MKTISIISALTLSAMLFTGCGSTSSEGSSKNSSDIYATLEVSEPQSNTGSELPDTSSGDIDIDLTQMDSNMIYAQVADMVNNSDDYMGKKVKVTGQFSYYQETDGREFFAVLVNDATACCSQGIEFVLPGEHKYPDDYPSVGTTITVIGDFNYYKEDDYYTYVQLLNAEMEVDKSLSWN